MTTDRFNLETFARGEADWSHTDTVETLDETAIERAPIADRPASGAYDNVLFLATDEEKLYRWVDGTSTWELIEQPPQNHGSSAHKAEVVHEGDGIDRDIYVIASGASDPAAAGPDDLIFEEE